MRYQLVVGRTLWAIALAAGLLGAAAFAPAAHGKAVSLTKVVNTPIPDSGPGVTGIFGQLDSTIQVPNQGKAKKVRDVNVTIQAAGAVGTTPISDLRFILYAPTGNHMYIWFNNGSFLATNLSLGPFTADDEARLDVGSGNPVNPTRLYAPWAGTATPDCCTGNAAPLSLFDNGPAAGTWTMKAIDDSNTETSTFVSWKLDIVTGKPFLTKVPGTKKK